MKNGYLKTATLLVSGLILVACTSGSIDLINESAYQEDTFIYEVSDEDQDTGQSGVEEYSESDAACQTFETDCGCFANSSYIADFIDQFWTDLLPEFQEIEANSSTQEEFESENLVFYNNYWDQFVSEYAATHPEEDFSESWNWYVFELEPEGDGQIAWDKIAFFSEYPELVAIAEQIRSNLK